MEFNFKQELMRKGVHIFAILYILIYYFFLKFYGHYAGLMALVFVLCFFLVIDYFRIEREKRILFFHRFWREKEKNRFGGQVFFILGVIIAFAVFDFKIALLGILMTIFGDLSSALIGKRFGKHYLISLEDRAWEGILAEFFVDVLIGFFVFFINWNSFSFVFNYQFLIVILVMAFVASFVETIVYKMDDNLVVPVFSGFAGQVVLRLLI